MLSKLNFVKEKISSIIVMCIVACSNTVPTILSDAHYNVQQRSLSAADITTGFVQCSIVHMHRHLSEFMLFKNGIPCMYVRMEVTGEVRACIQYSSQLTLHMLMVLSQETRVKLMPHGACGSSTRISNLV